MRTTAATADEKICTNPAIKNNESKSSTKLVGEDESIFSNLKY